MGLIEPISDMTAVRRILRFLLEKFTEKPIEIQEFHQVRSEVYALFEQQPFRLPAKMTFILKALTTLDGVARNLDPHYNLLTAARPFVKSLAVSNAKSNALGELAKQARDYITFRLRQPSTAERILQRLEDRLEQGELQARMRSLETDRALKTIQLAIRSLIYACVAGFTLLSAVILLVRSYTLWAIVAFILAGMTGLVLLRSLIHLAIRDRLDRLTGS
jgi:predicted unusual protein kinase regulating ubiquinone biosynthesis (AarF/ABC1/UbiB family)